MAITGITTFQEQSLDDILNVVLNALLISSNRVVASKGRMSEIAPAVICLTSPRARLSRTEMKGTVFSCFGELLWYLAGSNALPFIEHYLPRYPEYSDDGKTLHGAYGPRMFGSGVTAHQIQNVIELLRQRRTSRQAVVQLFRASDITAPHRDVPCTCTLQFLIRRSRLLLVATMRSNDAFWGLPHDIFSFTMIQELIARSLGVGIGNYVHQVGSLHLYDSHRQKAERFLSEGWQSSAVMPEMPPGDQWDYVKKMVDAESRIRNGRDVDNRSATLPRYWSDVVLLLQIHKILRLGHTHSKGREQVSKQVQELKGRLHYGGYRTYVDDKLSSLTSELNA